MIHWKKNIFATIVKRQEMSHAVTFDLKLQYVEELTRLCRGRAVCFGKRSGGRAPFAQVFLLTRTSPPVVQLLSI